MFAELRCKTNFSFLEGASHPHELIERASNIGLDALAITDVNGVYGIPKAYWKAKEYPQLKLIVGAEITMLGHPPLTFLAKDRKGYGLMCRILTAAHAGKEKGTAHLSLEELHAFASEEASTCLVVLAPSGSHYSILKSYFENRLYIPLARHKNGFDSARFARAKEDAHIFSCPIVASNDVLYHEAHRKPLHDALTCTKESVTLLEAGYKLTSNAERYLKSPFEMKLLFKDFPGAISNTLLVAEQCTFSPSELRYTYPSEWIPSHHTAQSYLEERVVQGAHERYKNGIPQDVQAQLTHELKLISELNFSDYFLTIDDLVCFARSRNILCQGRGSAANSSVCYCLGITAIDPVKMKLLFERFISKERGEPPDIDVDFEHERREEVIQYMYEKYGRHRAAMVSAVITYQKRSALRELSKAFGIDVGTRSSKKLVEEWQTLVQTSPIPKCSEHIDRLSDELHSFPRHLSIHSGGFTLSADPITEIVPIEPARMEGRTIIQWDKYDLDYLGLLKIDVLALGMLSALQKTLTSVGLQLHEIPQEDKATYKMIQKADTVGTFQVESRAQMNMSGRLMPRTFYDLVVQVAIVRPGPIVGQMVHPYLKRRRGIEELHYPHPKLREILGRTLGVPLFQEQLMKIAIELGDFTPGEADYLRRAIGAWRASGSIRKVAEKLFSKLMQKGIPEAYALNILEHMKGFAHYGFPESHAASFALLTYASCYLKCHYPAAFACGLINSQPMGFYAPHTLIDDAKRHGVKVFPIDPHTSLWQSTVEGNSLKLGLHMIHGLHKREAECIISQRPYTTLIDFIYKTKLRADTLERMILAGLCDSFGEDPRPTLWKLLSYKVSAKQTQLDLFRNDSTPSKSHAHFETLSELESIENQYHAFHASTLGHPMQALRQVHKLSKTTNFEAKRLPHKTWVTVSGLILVRQKPPTASGVCFSAIEDEHGILDLVIFQKEYERYRDIFLRNCFITVSGFIERDGHSVSLIVKNIRSIFKPIPSAPNKTLHIEPTQYFW